MIKSKLAGPGSLWESNSKIFIKAGKKQSNNHIEINMSLFGESVIKFLILLLTSPSFLYFNDTVTFEYTYIELLDEQSQATINYIAENCENIPEDLIQHLLFDADLLKLDEHGWRPIPNVVGNCNVIVLNWLIKHGNDIKIMSKSRVC